MESEKYLLSKQVIFKKLTLQEIPKTAQDVERIYWCGLDQVLKTLIFIGSKKPILVVLQWNKRVKMQKIRHIIWDNQIRPARPEEIYQITGYEIGGVSPFWFQSDIIKILNRSVLDIDKPINLGSGVAEIGFEMMPSELKKAWDGIFEEIEE